MPEHKDNYKEKPPESHPEPVKIMKAVLKFIAATGLYLWYITELKI